MRLIFRVSAAGALMILLPTASTVSSCAAIALLNFESEAQTASRIENRQAIDAIFKDIETLLDAGKVITARERIIALSSVERESAIGRYLEAKLLFKEHRFVDSIKMLESLLLIENQKNTAAGIVRQANAEQLKCESYKLLAMNYILIDRLDLAEPVLKTAIGMWPDDYLIHFHLGMLYYTTSRFAAAEKELRQVINLRPGFIKGYDGLGLALEELGQEEAAIESYRRALELAEKTKLADSSPYFNLSKLLQRKNRFEESLPLLEKALRLSPQAAEIAYYYGKALHKTGRPTEAVLMLLRSARNDPAFAEPYYLLSRIYLDLGRTDEAQKQMLMFEQLRRNAQAKRGRPAGAHNSQQ